MRLWRYVGWCGTVGLVLGLVGAGRSEERGAQVQPAKVSPRQTPYVHVVLFSLKKDAPAGEVDALIRDSQQLLGKIPSVRGLWVGRPAEQATPKFARRDYHVGLLVLFENYAGLEAYLNHPLHQEYLRRHGPYWEQVPVYDFLQQAP